MTQESPWLEMSRAARLVVLATWFVLSNNYFGWNRFPMSTAELFSDLATLALVIVAFWPRSITCIEIKEIHDYRNCDCED